MTTIQASNLSKRYGFQWIIRDQSFELTSKDVHGIAGANGSGKSTMMKILSGYLSQSQGTIKYSINGNTIPVSRIYQYLSLAAPYTDLINEFTLDEMLQFHSKFKKLRVNVSYSDFEDIIRLKVSRDKTLNQFSSGMKQKIQLALAILSDTPILLMDEPTSFLDKNAKSWFHDMVLKYRNDRLIVIASNDPFDLELCSKQINMYI
ncbi:MAG: ABC transporter ATP-binding protein [Saprospiraceae bacterium]|nr:MAG: ABC transporter ATP-binding protein [Bacteroidetes bacterium OLB9]MCO6463273.1 ABC transporter ATP-binding protein [Saprospiraceae bacterium]MCZ2337303.1 ATP-binding cassette domain-containing protein [Chitinophagales bacterium]